MAKKAPLRWTFEKPQAAGWYWYRGAVEEAEPFVVQVDEVGYFQWPDGEFQDARLTKGQWAGPIEFPEEP
jgi:hypothetical protein